MLEQTYDVGESYKFNYDRGPVFRSPPPPVQAVPMKRFLDLPVRSRIGIAAGLLLNSKWILGYAQRGFDILTYKTVRSAYRPCQEMPNWVFLRETQITDGPVHTIDVAELDEPTTVSSAVSFGMPSMAPDQWRPDVAKARQGLADGQVLIVSVVGTPDDTGDAQQLAADFAQCAAWAAEAGADVVEANFSCPNVCTAEGSIYLDATFSKQIAAAIRSAVGDVPVLIKAGQFPDEPSAQRFLTAVNGLVNGVVLVNGLTRAIVDDAGNPAFGADRPRAGVLGRAIHQPCVDATRQAVDICRRRRLDLSIVSVGGVSRAADMADYFDSGAAAVMLGSSPMYLPDLAADARQQHQDW